MLERRSDARSDLGVEMCASCETSSIACTMGPEATLRELLGEEMPSTPVSLVTEASAAPVPNEETFEGPYRVFRDRWNDRGEREYVRRLLVRHGGNNPSAAREAEIDRTYMYRLVRKHGL